MTRSINFSDISVVMQGNIRPETEDAIRSVREVLPGATLILSTFEADVTSGKTEGLNVDSLVVSPDPGGLPSYTRSKVAGPNNLNRQIVSTQAGMKRVSTPFVLKLRTDCLLTTDAFIDVFEAAYRADPERSRMVAGGFFTRHPCGISGYTFHVSDWFTFGQTGQVKDLWSAPLMSVKDATWFDSRPHEILSTPSARRFRGRFTPEQHICVAYAKRHGYVVPEYFNQRTPEIVEDAKRFIGSEFVIDTPANLGISLPKYAHIARSRYQNIDCVLYHDWRELFDQYSKPASSQKKFTNRFAARVLARRFRYFLSGGALLAAWFKKRVALLRDTTSIFNKEKTHA